MKTYVYIDGFNMYYRALKNTKYKWLDFMSLCKLLLKPTDTIECIKYFTAIVNGIGDTDRPIRQKTYIRALKTYIPELKVYYGKFLTNNIKMPLVNPQNNVKLAEVIKTEEKGSDVNLAVHLLNDAWLNLYDCAVIISNDSDLLEAIRIVKVQCKKQIGLFIPEKRHPSVELIKLADFRKPIRSTVLANSQLPNPIPNTTIHKPTSW
ncbi:MAG: NYN domain-containing protein [Nitrospirae bacterium YQR-1]